MIRLLQTRRAQVAVAVAILICLLALLAPHAAVHGSLLVCVLFFPVFLFGLLDISWLWRAAFYIDSSLLPQAPLLATTFQRPPPSRN